MSTTVATRPAGSRRTAGLTLAALGVVFGDIGTSPLYTVQTCFSDFTGLKPTPENVMGMLSLIWQRKLFLILMRFAASPAEFFGLPADRVVELGSRLEI